MDLLEGVVDTLARIAATGSRKTKLTILREARTPQLEKALKEAIHIALSWYRHFGVQHMPQSPAWPIGHQQLTWEGFLTIIQRLEGGENIDKAWLASALGYATERTTLWARRILTKDLRAGISSGTVNKVWPDFIETFEVQNADSLLMTSVATIGYPRIGELKIDGVRMIMKVDVPRREFTAWSRGGNEFRVPEPWVEVIIDALAEDCWGVVYLDSEAYAGNYPDTMSVIKRKVTAVPQELLDKFSIRVFDMLSEAEWDQGFSNMPLTERHEMIPFPENDEHVQTTHLVVRTTQYVLNTPEELEAFTLKGLDLGWEGSMIKKPSGRYQKVRNANWLKYKPVETGDFEVLSSYESDRWPGHLGGFVIQVKPGVTCNAGGGLKKVQRKDLWARRNELPGIFLEIEYKMFTRDGKLREPVIKHIREDK